MKKANFKAILAMLLVGVMGVSMTACSGNGDDRQQRREQLCGKQLRSFCKRRTAGTGRTEHRFVPRWYS